MEIEVIGNYDEEAFEKPEPKKVQAVTQEMVKTLLTELKIIF